MRKCIIKIAFCTIMGLSIGWFWYAGFIKSPPKAPVVSKQEKPIKIYTKIVNGRWEE